MTKFSNQADGPYRRILKWNKLTTPSERRIFLPLSSYAERVFEKSIYTSINAEFIDVLENLKIDSVLIAGLDTDCCVLTTAVDLFQNNITPIVLTDYCASNGGMESHKSAIIVLKRLIGENHVIDGLIDAQALKKIHEIVKESNSTEE